MKKYFYTLLVFSFFHFNSFGQKKISISQFNWTIEIPNNYTEVDPETWGNQQKKGEELIENTFGEELTNETVTLFVYKNEELNSIESNYQPFDEAIDGNYIEVFDDVNALLYETMITQLPDIEIETKRGAKMIDNLLFQSFEMKITYPNKMIVYFLMFSMLFEKEELTINIIYVDEKQGELMKNALFNSKFGK